MPAFTARFVLSAPSLAELPDHGLPEIAFAGRSNVGKSTLLGAVMAQPDLVRTSRTPGRTRLLNLFVFAERLALVDLPGYGYAKMSKSDREKLNVMVRGYLAGRQGLAAVVLVIDARRDPVSEYDQWVAGWVSEHGRPLVLAVTKSDQVPKNRRLTRARVIERALGAPTGTALMCSGKSREGIEELRWRLWELGRMTPLWLGLVAAAPNAVVIDQIVAVVDKEIVTESELVLEARIALITREKGRGYQLADGPLDEELLVLTRDYVVNQLLIAAHVRRLGTVDVSTEEVEAALADLIAAFPTHDAFLAFKRRYDISEETIRNILRRDLRNARFIEQRLRTSVGGDTDDEEREQRARRALERWLIDLRKGAEVRLLGPQGELEVQ